MAAFTKLMTSILFAILILRSARSSDARYLYGEGLYSEESSDRKEIKNSLIVTEDEQHQGDSTSAKEVREDLENHLGHFLLESEKNDPVRELFRGAMPKSEKYRTSIRNKLKREDAELSVSSSTGKLSEGFSLAGVHDKLRKGGVSLWRGRELQPGKGGTGAWRGKREEKLAQGNDQRVFEFDTTKSAGGIHFFDGASKYEDSQLQDGPRKDDMDAQAISDITTKDTPRPKGGMAIWRGKDSEKVKEQKI